MAEFLARLPMDGLALRNRLLVAASADIGPLVLTIDVSREPVSAGP